LKTYSQITLNTSYFPVIGDSLKIATASNPRSVQNGQPGANGNWDFSNLTASSINISVAQSPSQSSNAAEFPGATFITKTRNANNPTQSTDNFFKTSTNKVELMGFAGQAPVQLPVNVTARYNPLNVERRAPLKFFDVNTSSSALNIAFPSSILPDSLFNGVPFKPDSIRVSFTSDRTEIIDAWGKMKIPNGTFDVLREKRIDKTNTKIEVKVPFLGWVDLSALTGGGGGGFGNFTGLDTTVTYHYWTNNVKEPIALVTVDPVNNDSILRIQFKAINIKVGTEELQVDWTWNVYPNPCLSDCRIDLTNLPKGNYTLDLYDFSGKLYRQYTMQDTDRYSIDKPQKGVYFLVLRNKETKTFDKRILVVHE